MRILINIDDDLYTRLFDNGDEYVADMRRACVAIRKGIPLPKGHGRLIDADEMKTMKNIQSANFNAVELIRYWIDNQPTIIEADTAESEDKG